MYEMYASLMRAAGTGHSAPSRRRAGIVTRSHHGRGRGLGIRSHAAGKADSPVSAGTVSASTGLRPACAGVDAAAR